MRRLILVLFVPCLAFAIYDMEWFDLNHWRVPFQNYGPWGFDPATGSGEAGGSWPQPWLNKYVFGAGPWVGAKAGDDTLVSCGYNPNSGGSEFFPTLCRYWREPDSADRIYRYPGDWPPPQTRFPMAPADPTGEMTFWMCFCDSEPDQHIAPGRPLGLDICLTAFAWNLPHAEDLVFLKYELANIHSTAMEDLYFGPVMDPDVGAHSDDMFGLILDKTFYIQGDTIRVKDIAFAYDFDNIEVRNARMQWDTGCPGAVALKLLHAPQSLPLTAVKKFSIDFDPVTDQAQYLTMAGYDYRTGIYNPFDSIDLAPADKRFLMSSGPFTIPAQSQVTFYYALVGSPFGEWGQNPEQRADTNELALRCHWADSIFERLMGIAEQSPHKQPSQVRAWPSLVRPGTPVGVSGCGPSGICVYDRCGTLVRRLAGPNPVWDCRDDRGSLVASGVYLLRPAGRSSGPCGRVVVLGN